MSSRFYGSNGSLSVERKNKMKIEKKRKKWKNKPDRATMRPGCVFACIDHVTYMERQMDEQTGETTK